MRKTPSNQALDVLISIGWLPDHAERKITRTLTRDWHGFADVLAFRERHSGVLALQVTSASNVAARVKKCLGSEIAKAFARHNQVEVWGFFPDGRIKCRSLILDGERFYAADVSLVLARSEVPEVRRGIYRLIGR